MRVWFGAGRDGSVCHALETEGLKVAPVREVERRGPPYLFDVRRVAFRKANGQDVFLDLVDPFENLASEWTFGQAQIDLVRLRRIEGVFPRNRGGRLEFRDRG